MPTGYLEIEQLVQAAKEDLAAVGVAALVAGAVTEWPQLVTSEIGMEITKYAAAYVVRILLENGEFVAFILNTRILTSQEAAEYRAAVAKRLQAPETISDEDWEELENARIKAFRNMVRLVS